ncbi:MAG: transglutaminase family protein [Pseudomonadota bacterium]
MLYDIRLVLSYSYASTALNARNLLRVMPAQRPGVQRLIAGALTAEPAPTLRRDRHDFFGNDVTELDFHLPVTAQRFELTARVERQAAPTEFDLSTRLADLPARLREAASLDPDAPWHFLAPSPSVPRVAEIEAYARAQAGGANTVLEAVAALGSAIHRDLRFDATATEVDTPVSQAFAKRHGVCQDFSHIMIGGLRGLGVPAGYVSGYLRTLPPEGQPRLDGADAMHAWVRAWCGPQTGWVEHDPTNNVMVGADHIVVAVGRDYTDCAPLRGSIRASGDQISRQEVDVIRAE